MDSNSDTNLKKNKLNKNYLLIKLPANIQNPNKALEALGGKELIQNKVTTH
jgi:hypothetical protein